MTAVIDKTYRKEKLLDWSLTKKFTDFSFSKKSMWLPLGLIILGVSNFAFIIPFIPLRFGCRNWTLVETVERVLVYETTRNVSK